MTSFQMLHVFVYFNKLWVLNAPCPVGFGRVSWARLTGVLIIPYWDTPKYLFGILNLSVQFFACMQNSKKHAAFLENHAKNIFAKKYHCKYLDEKQNHLGCLLSDQPLG